MSDNSANQYANVVAPLTIADVLAGLQRMGDLSQFVIDDLTPEDEDLFFGILDGASHDPAAATELRPHCDE